MTDSVADAWLEYLEQLREIPGMLATSTFHKGATLQSMAYKELARVLSLSNFQYVSENNPLAPRLVRADWGFPNPDNTYTSCTLEDAGEYRIYGRFGTAKQSYVSLYKSTDHGSGLKAGSLRREDMVLAQNGEFELWITRENKPEYDNWLPMEDGVNAVCIYQIFADWNTETKGWYGIERLDTIGQVPDRPSPVEMSDRLIQSAKAVQSKLKYWQMLSQRINNDGDANEITGPVRNKMTSLGTVVYNGHWSLQEDDALVVTIEPSEDATYWGFCAYSPMTDPLDYTDRQGSLNMSQVIPDEDGKIRIVLSHQDPGIPNWIDIGGMEEGIFALRVTVEGDLEVTSSKEVDADSGVGEELHRRETFETDFEKPSTTVVSLPELTQVLPSATRKIGLSERAENIRKRRQHLQYRLS